MRTLQFQFLYLPGVPVGSMIGSLNIDLGLLPIHARSSQQQLQVNYLIDSSLSKSIRQDSANNSETVVKKPALVLVPPIPSLTN